MHLTAMKNAKDFFGVYGGRFGSGKVLDVGSQNVNGSLKDVCPNQLTYTGVDFVQAAGVDVVMTDPYLLPFPSEYADIVVSSSCFEHSEMFWLLFLEIMRVLKPAGLFYLNAPSNGPFHRHPCDCWRFYPDSGRALVQWAQRNDINACLLESYTSLQEEEGWNDYVAVILKDAFNRHHYKDHIFELRNDIENISCFGRDNLDRGQVQVEDRRKYLGLLDQYTSVKPLAKQLVRTVRRRLGNIVNGA